jgi:hypothetical protein
MFDSCIRNCIKQIWRRSSHVTWRHGWYSAIIVPCIVTFSAGWRGVLSVAYRPQYPQNKSTRIGWVWGSGGHRACLENIEKRKFNSHCGSKHYFWVASFQVTTHFELYGVPHMGLFLDCLGYAARKKFALVNCISWIASVFCALYQMLRPFNRFRCSCTDRKT